MPVFTFAILLVSIVNPFFSITIRNPVTKRSLKIISETIQYSTTPKTANEMKADETKILSARGSKKRPCAVTRLYFRAKYPS